MIVESKKLQNSIKIIVCVVKRAQSIIVVFLNFFHSVVRNPRFAQHCFQEIIKIGKVERVPLVTHLDFSVT